MFQPMTTDHTPEGLRRARNGLRKHLWADDRFAHRWLCHAERECEDGCSFLPPPARLVFYQTPIER